MTKRAKTCREIEITEWHQEFQRIKDDWIEWLRANAAYFSTSEDAWDAFKAERQREYMFIIPEVGGMA